MKIMYCWRCRQNVPMLDEDEYAKIHALYGKCISNPVKHQYSNVDEVFEPVRKEYERMTGLADCHHNVIMHHRISLYGELCKQCGKPLRPKRAKVCRYCDKEIEPE